MEARPNDSGLNRRSFLKRSAGLAAFAAAASSPGVQAVEPTNPFAYDVAHLEHTDPKLIQYAEVARWHCPRPEVRRIASGPTGQIYVAAGNYLTELDAQGAPKSEIALASAVRSVAFGRDGTVYIGTRDEINVFDSKGERRATWRAPGTKAWFTDLAVSDEHLYAADAGNRVLLRYDLAGKVIGRIGEKNKERNIPGFIVPSPFFDVEAHRDGLLRVSNPGRHRVEAYTADGDLEVVWGKASAAIAGFCGCCNPIHIGVLPDGRILTCEKGLPRVKIYRTDGTFDCVVAGPESFPENCRVAAGESLSDSRHGGLDATVDGQGRIHILDLVTTQVHVLVSKAGSKNPSAQRPTGG